MEFLVNNHTSSDIEMKTKNTKSKFKQNIAVCIPEV